MRNIKIPRLALLLLLSLASAQASTFRMRLIGDPETLDWNRAHTPVETYLLMNLMEGLVRYEKGPGVRPGLAKRLPRVTRGGRVYTFDLRQDVRWSDGVPLQAKHFVYSWRRLLSPKTAAAYAYFLFDIKGARDFNAGRIKDFSQVGVKALGPHKLQVTLEKPVAHWIYLPTFWVTFPMREDLVKKHGASWVKPKNMVTVGPFTLADYKVNSKVVLKANDKYYGARGNVKKVEGLIVRDNSTALNLYETGRLDFLNDISSLDLQRLKKRTDLKTFPYLKTVYLGFVVTQKPMDNPAVRKAIAMTVDKSKLVGILNGGQVPAGSFVPPQLLAGGARAGLPRDLKVAKALAKKSGFKGKIPLLVPNRENSLLVAQYLQAELKTHLDFEIDIQPFDFKTFRKQVDLKTHAIYLLSWGADYPDSDNFFSMWLSGSGNNRTNWKSEKYDNLILKARTKRGRRTRTKLYQQAQNLLLEKDAAVLALYHEPNKALVKKRVRGLTLNPLNYLFLREVSLAGNP